MELLYIFFTSLGSIIVLFILTKIMGNREMSQLSMFDYINGITIGSIAAEMATSLENDFLKPLTAMVVYTMVIVLISLVNSKSIKMRRFINGETLILLDDGKLYRENFKKAKLDIGEFLTQCRKSGYFDISNLQTAILEPNGRISFLPLSTQRPVTPNDLKLTPPKEKPLVNIIIDGKILPDNLKFIGKDEKWVEKQLNVQGVSKVSDVFLGICDNKNNLIIYVKINKPMTRDIFE